MAPAAGAGDVWSATPGPMALARRSGGPYLPPMERTPTGSIRVRSVAGGTGRTVSLADLGTILADRSTRTWIDLTGPTVEQVVEVGRILGLHPLVAQNIGEPAQRARIEQVEDHVRIVLFAIRFDAEVETAGIDFVLGDRYLLTVHGPAWDPLTAPHLQGGVDPILARGADYLFYTFGDWIVDGYFPVLDRLGDEIDELQDDAVASALPGTLQRLFQLKRELITLRRATSPAREVFNQLTDRETSMVAPDHVVYLRDVHDHLLRVADELDSYRDLLSGALEVYLSTINNNLSVIMKRLTGVTVILAGIGAIAGVFGMSEAGRVFGGEEPGFWLIALGTVLAASVAAFVLRRADWI